MFELVIYLVLAAIVFTFLMIMGDYYKQQKEIRFLRKANEELRSAIATPEVYYGVVSDVVAKDRERAQHRLTVANRKHKAVYEQALKCLDLLDKEKQQFEAQYRSVLSEAKKFEAVLQKVRDTRGSPRMVAHDALEGSYRSLTFKACPERLEYLRSLPDPEPDVEDVVQVTCVWKGIET